MALLNTGLVIAGGYADKVRKTLFAQLKDAVKRGELTSQEVARAAAELNRVVYHILVEKIKLEKGDVVRIRVEYDVENGKIAWKYDTLTIEAFSRMSDEEVAKVVQEVVSSLERLEALKEVVYEVEKVVTTALGDYIYRITLEGREVGMLIVTPLNEETVIVRGAVLEPTPTIVDRARLMLEGRSVDEAISSGLADLLKAGRSSELEEAQKVVNDIKAVAEREGGG